MITAFVLPQTKCDLNRRPYNLYCVGGDVKPCSINQSINVFWTVAVILCSICYVELAVHNNNSNNNRLNSQWISNLGKKIAEVSGEVSCSSVARCWCNILVLFFYTTASLISTASFFIVNLKPT